MAPHLLGYLDRSSWRSSLFAAQEQQQAHLTTLVLLPLWSPKTSGSYGTSHNILFSYILNLALSDGDCYMAPILLSDRFESNAVVFSIPFWLQQLFHSPVTESLYSSMIWHHLMSCWTTHSSIWRICTPTKHILRAPVTYTDAHHTFLAHLCNWSLRKTKRFIGTTKPFQSSTGHRPGDTLGSSSSQLDLNV